MTSDELTDRILDLFPQLAEVPDWIWNETEEGEPVVMIEGNATFTGLDDGRIDLTGPIPNTTLIGIYRIQPSGRFDLVGLAPDAFAVAAAEQARQN